MDASEFNNKLSIAREVFLTARDDYYSYKRHLVQEMIKSGWIRFDNYRREYGESYGRDVLLSPEFQVRYGITPSSSEREIIRALQDWDEDEDEDGVIDLVDWWSM